MYTNEAVARLVNRLNLGAKRNRNKVFKTPDDAVIHERYFTSLYILAEVLSWADSNKLPDDTEEQIESLTKSRDYYKALANDLDRKNRTLQDMLDTINDHSNEISRVLSCARGEEENAPRQTTAQEV